MSRLKETTAAGLQVDRAASDPKDVVRKGEFDTAIAACPTTAEMEAAVAAVEHDAVTTADSDTVALVLTGQQITANVTPAAADSGLLTTGGLAVAFGEANDEVARGDHTHDNDHVAASADNTSTSATVTVTDQAVKVEVIVDPAGNLSIGDNGVGVTAGAFAEAVHTHSNATSGVAGFMSTTDKLKLDALSASGYVFVSTDTVSITVGGSYISANARTGAGLTQTASGIEVDYTQVAQYGHTHAAATSSGSGLMTAAQVQALSAVNYIYLGWADSVSGGNPVNFSLTRDVNKTCLAILTSATAIAAPQASDFANLWFEITTPA